MNSHARQPATGGARDRAALDSIAEAIRRLEDAGAEGSEALEAVGQALQAAAPCGPRSLAALPDLSLRAWHGLRSVRERGIRVQRRNARILQLREGNGRYSTLGRRAASRAIAADMAEYLKHRWIEDQRRGQSPEADPDRTFFAIIDDGSALIGPSQRTLSAAAIFKLIE